MLGWAIDLKAKEHQGFGRKAITLGHFSIDGRVNDNKVINFQVSCIHKAS